MTATAITLDVDETLNVHLDVLAQVALNISLVLNHHTDAVDLVLAQVLDFLEGIDIRLLQNLERTRITDAENVRKRDPSLLVAGQIYASNSCHSISFAASVVCPRPQPVRTGYASTPPGVHRKP